jgi:hypothetical protein
VYRQPDIDCGWRELNRWVDGVCHKEAFLEDQAKASNKQNRKRAKGDGKQWGRRQKRSKSSLLKFTINTIEGEK